MSDKKYFDTLNNGKGLDHWSPSSSSMPLAKFNLNYGHHDGEERSMFPMQYKPRFGNLVNNTAQRLTCEVLYQGDKKITLENKNYDDIFQQELDAIDKDSPPVDEKDKLAREMMVSFAHPTIENMKKCVKEIFGNKKLVAERYVSSKSKDMIHDIIGRIDYESNDIIGEAKTKPVTIKKKRGKDEYYMATTQLPNDPDPMHISQVAFYFHCTQKKPFLFYVNENEYRIFDDTHDMLRPDYLKEQYNLMTQRLKSWEELIVFCEGNLEKLAHFAEPPELNHPFYYRDLIDDQKKQIKKLWGLDA